MRVTFKIALKKEKTATLGATWSRLDCSPSIDDHSPEEHLGMKANGSRKASWMLLDL